jgi:hypothetical protein
MRVYHFLNEQYGLQAIADARLKIGRLASFNDPFEYFHLDTDNCGTRDVIRGRRKRANWDYGIICFSKNYYNPVQWAHYSDSHRGLCLGFDIPDTELIEIDYVNKRSPPEEFKKSLDYKKENFVKHMLSKKYKHWEYEEEFRLLIKFAKRKMDNDLTFHDFCENMVLKEVIMGFRSSIVKKDLRKLLNKNYRGVEIRNVFPSNSEYKMELQV